MNVINLWEGHIEGDIGREDHASLYIYTKFLKNE